MYCWQFVNKPMHCDISVSFNVIIPSIISRLKLKVVTMLSCGWIVIKKERTSVSRYVSVQYN